MFLGEYAHSLDEKNRVVFPLALRKHLPDQKLEEGFVLAAGTLNRCLDLHPKAEWRAHVETFERRHAPEDEEAQEYLRDLLSSAVEIQLDKQYRILLPEARLAEAGIGREVIFVGMSKKIEIWPRASWEARRTKRKGQMKQPPATDVPGRAPP
jgi:MraZ protein